MTTEKFPIDLGKLLPLKLNPAVTSLTDEQRAALRQVLVRDSEINWRHLAATASIPLCFPPIEIRGRQYVDGGFRGGLPLWAAAPGGIGRRSACEN